MACDEVLKQLGVHDALVFGRVAAIDFLPLERDVLSLEHENAWRDLAVEGDITPVYYVARALHQLQKVTGEAPLVKGKGTHAKEVAEVVERLRREAHVNEARRLDAWSDEDLPDDELFESSSSSDENSEDDDEDSRGFADHLPPIDFGDFPKGPPRRAGAAFRSKQHCASDCNQAGQLADRLFAASGGIRIAPRLEMDVSRDAAEAQTNEWVDRTLLPALARAEG